MASLEQSRTEVLWPSGLRGNCWILAPQGEAPLAGTVLQKFECWYPVAALPLLTISSHHLFQSTLIHLGFSTSVCHFAPDLTKPARPPQGSGQHWQSSRVDRVQWVQQGVMWVQLLLMHELEQPHRHFPQARGLSFAQGPLGQYHCKGKECWNKHNFTSTKRRQNMFLLEPREVESGHGTREDHRAGSSVNSQHDTGQLQH